MGQSNVANAKPVPEQFMPLVEKELINNVCILKRLPKETSHT
jgi:hypothetical protein